MPKSESTRKSGSEKLRESKAKIPHSMDHGPIPWNTKGIRLVGGDRTINDSKKLQSQQQVVN